MPSLYLQTALETSIHATITHPANPDSRKPLIVFLHYYGGTSSTWHKLTTPDTPTSLTSIYPTLAIDLRGWGKSTGPTTDNDTEYSATSMASDVATILSKMRTKSSDPTPFEHGFVLVGHSMGAKVALASLGNLPQDLLGLLKGFVLVAPAPPIGLDLPPEMKAQQQVAYDSQESIRWTIEHVLANSEMLTDDDIALVVRDSLGGNPPAKKAWPLYGMKEDVSQQVANSLDACHGLRASVVSGELDIVEPNEKVEAHVVSFLTEHKVQVTSKVAKGVKHLIPFEDAASVYEEICQF